MNLSKPQLWKILNEKFCVRLKHDFSNKDIDGWLSHFSQNKKINIYQHNNNKITKIYTGSLFNSILNGRVPAKVMAKIYFKKLSKLNYSHSDIELLGIQHNTAKEHIAKVLIRFLRYNTAGDMYESAMGLYQLENLDNEWLINEMAIYKDDKASIPSHLLKDMWVLKNKTSTHD